MLPLGQIYAELGQKLPATGGEFVYAYRFFGNKAVTTGEGGELIVK